MMQSFSLVQYRWHVLVYYLDRSDEAERDEIRSGLASLGYDGTHPPGVEELLAGKPDTGMTYTDLETRRTIIVIGRTTSAEECANTITHERMHLCMHICKLLRIDPFSERAAYLQGEIGAKMYKYARTLLCTECRKKFLSAMY